MRWGIRKATKKGTSYTYKSHGQKKYEKRLNKLTSKGAKAEKIAKNKEKLDIYKTRDKNRQSYAERTNVGKSFIKTLALGPIGAGSYNRYRGAGNSRTAAFLKSNILMSTLGAPVSILASRGAEFKSAKLELRAKGNRI